MEQSLKRSHASLTATIFVLMSHVSGIWLAEVIQEIYDERINCGVFLHALLPTQLLISFQRAASQFESVAELRMIVDPLRITHLRPSHRLMWRSKIRRTAAKQELRERERAGGDY